MTSSRGGRFKQHCSTLVLLLVTKGPRLLKCNGPRWSLRALFISALSLKICYFCFHKESLCLESVALDSHSGGKRKCVGCRWWMSG